VTRLGLLSILLLLAAGCSSDGSAPPPAAAWDCEELPLAVVDVNGVYRFSGEGIYSMLGTITFEQTGTTVRVVGTHYDNVDDRELEGEATIVGNKLEITLVPINGDLDYSADVTLLFSPDGESFCCAFSDTNDDVGSMGSYKGVRE
jgi:hypothetical protein